MALQGLLDQAFSYWKYKQSDALSGALHEITSKLQNDFGESGADALLETNSHLSSAVTSFCEVLLNGATKATNVNALDKLQHSLEIKRSVFASFILFLKDARLFHLIQESDRFYLYALLERLVGIQNLRHFHKLSDHVFKEVIASLVCVDMPTSYEIEKENKKLAKNEVFQLFYDKVCTSHFFMFSMLNYFKKLTHEQVQEQWIISPCKCRSISSLNSTMDIMKTLRGYISAILSASDHYRDELDLPDNPHVDEYMQLDCPFLHEVLPGASLEWFVTTEWQGETLLSCLINLAIIASDVCNIATYGRSGPNADSIDREYEEAIYLTVEVCFALCVHLLEVGFRIFCLATPLDPNFNLVKQQLFPCCKSLEKYATKTLNRLNGTSGVCGMEYTLELAQKYLHAPSIVEISVWNEAHGNKHLYTLENMMEQMMESRYFCDIIFDYFVRVDSHKYLLFQLPYELTNEAYRYLSNHSKMRWPILMRLAQQRAELVDFGGSPDWVDSMIGCAIDNSKKEVLQEAPDYQEGSPYLKAIQRAFLDIYAIAMGSDDMNERLFYLFMAKVAAKGGIEIPNKSLPILATSTNASFAEDVMIDDIDYEKLLISLRMTHLEDMDSPMDSMDILSNVLNNLQNKQISTSKERRKMRTALRDISLVLSRCVLSGVKPSISKAFWTLVLKVDTIIWEKLFQMDSIAADLSETNASNYNVTVSMSSDRKSLAANLCQHSLLYELLLKFDWGILRYKHSVDIRTIAESIDRRLVQWINHSMLLYEAYRNERARYILAQKCDAL